MWGFLAVNGEKNDSKITIMKKKTGQNVKETMMATFTKKGTEEM